MQLLANPTLQHDNEIVTAEDSGVSYKWLNIPAYDVSTHTLNDKAHFINLPGKDTGGYIDVGWQAASVTLTQAFALSAGETAVAKLLVNVPDKLKDAHYTFALFDKDGTTAITDADGRTAVRQVFIREAGEQAFWDFVIHAVDAVELTLSVTVGCMRASNPGGSRIEVLGIELNTVEADYAEDDAIIRFEITNPEPTPPDTPPPTSPPDDGDILGITLTLTDLTPKELGAIALALMRVRNE